jgi:hypothetical protein
MRWPALLAGLVVTTMKVYWFVLGLRQVFYPKKPSYPKAIECLLSMVRALVSTSFITLPICKTSRWHGFVDFFCVQP